MLLAIDHGNYNIKTPHHCFMAGLAEHSVRPPMVDDPKAEGLCIADTDQLSKAQLLAGCVFWVRRSGCCGRRPISTLRKNICCEGNIAGSEG